MGRTRSILYIMITMILAMTLSCRVVVAAILIAQKASVTSGALFKRAIFSLKSPSPGARPEYFQLNVLDSDRVLARYVVIPAQETKSL